MPPPSPIRVTLPDGSVKEFDGPVTGRAVAESIGARLAKAALGVKVDGELRDVATVIDRDCRVQVVTEKNRDGTPDPDGLFLMRHSAAHVMAEAIGRIVPGVRLAYGPPLPTGFYYDMWVPEGRPLTSGDFEAIEREMHAILKEDRAFTRYEMGAEEGLAKLRAEGNKYKLDNAERALRGGDPSADPGKEGAGTVQQQAGPDGGRDARPTSDARPTPVLSFYATGAPGKDWEDLCRGPHVPSTGRIGAVKVMSLASSYWRGDETSDRLTRVYGTAFASQADLDAHLNQLEEAKRRDHRVIGKHLRLFHIDETVGQGLILWTPEGSIIRQELQDFVGAELKKQGYVQVFTPHIGRLDLYKTSGHFPYYKESQYPPIAEREALERLAGEGCSCAALSNGLEGVSAKLRRDLNARTGRETIPESRVMPDEQLVEGYLLKPMNCPHHVKIFASRPHSYRDMPVRLAEFGTVYRWEQSGELNGLTRVRGFTVDDAHLFCTEEQVPAEVQGCLSLVKLTFATLGLTDYRVRVGLRDPDSDKYTGNPENWDKAERACREAAASLGVPFSEEPGEAAFYGPKIDFVVKDVIGREWQLGTVQVDYNLPVRFDLSYIGADNTAHRPVMIHRAPFGSLERFCGVLIEHFAGAFPTWLSPEQARVLPISEKTNAYAGKVLEALKGAGVRATLDTSNERIQAKIKAAAEWKIPYLLVVGPRDEEAGSVSVRARGEGGDLGAFPLATFVEAIKREISERAGVAAIGVLAQ